jgi:hypothetical protein
MPRGIVDRRRSSNVLRRAEPDPDPIERVDGVEWM